jgi:uncharacterized repeat protein (TIGR03803 family)
MSRLTSAKLFSASILVAVTIFSSFTLCAQTYTILHSFTGASDGGTPYAGVTRDNGGNLYGTTFAGGATNCTGGCGTVFKLSRGGEGWTLSRLLTFTGGADGAQPQGRVVFGPDGALYGATSGGGIFSPYGHGNVFRLTPPRSLCRTVSCSWVETVLYAFQGSPDGADPGYGDLTFDAAGNIYGTTITGGTGTCLDALPCGTAFRLVHSNGSYVEGVIHDFGQGPGSWPFTGVTLDASGNAYGTTSEPDFAGHSGGTVYELSFSQGQWRATTLQTNLAGPMGGVLFDQAGNIFASNPYGGSGGGSVFELVPSGGRYTYQNVYSFTCPQGCPEPGGPTDTLIMDASGALYGTTYSAGLYGCGAAFKLSFSGGRWHYTPLHDFGCGTDGGYPWGQVTMDANGNLYGTATVGGASYGSGACQFGEGCGVVWEIKP